MCPVINKIFLNNLWFILIIFFSGKFYLKILQVTFCPAVAILVPPWFNEIADKGDSWAGISIGGLSVFAKSTNCTWPVLRLGKASNELMLLGHKTQSPKKRHKKSMQITKN